MIQPNKICKFVAAYPVLVNACSFFNLLIDRWNKFAFFNNIINIFVINPGLNL